MNAPIPMRNDARLAANLYLPSGGGSGLWPAIMEYAPYREDLGHQRRSCTF
jgi:predicted acyl esterase